MTKCKKSKDSDIAKLRMILDNPSDQKVKKIVDEHEKNLESIRKRLSGDSSEDMMVNNTSDFLKKSDSLEPKVVIHKKEEDVIPSKIESTEKEVQKEEKKDEADTKDLFDDEELFEIEKIEVSKPEFLEVQPKISEKTMSKEEDFSTPMQDGKEPIKEMHGDDEELPEWEPVEESKPEKIYKGKIKTNEFKEIAKIDEKAETPTITDEKDEKITTWIPIESEKTMDEEKTSKLVNAKHDIETSELVSGKKEETETAVEMKKVELKRTEKELKRKRKEEQKLKKLDIKKKKREAKKIEREKKTQLKAQLKNRKTSDVLKSKKAKLKKTEPETPSQKFDEDNSFEENLKDKKVPEWESYDVEEIPEVESNTSLYTHGEYTLYKKDIKTATGRKRTIHFFSKKIPEIGEPAQLPDNYEVKVNKRTGLPYLKRKK
jgi:hypothetical protein